MAIVINQAMVRVYANLVTNGRRTIESLPADYQEPVLAYLNQS